MENLANVHNGGGRWMDWATVVGQTKVDLSGIPDDAEMLIEVLTDLAGCHSEVIRKSTLTEDSVRYDWGYDSKQSSWLCGQFYCSRNSFNLHYFCSGTGGTTHHDYASTAKIRISYR